VSFCLSPLLFVPVFISFVPWKERKYCMCKRPVMHRDSLSSSLDNSLASHKKRPRSLCFKPVFSRRKDSLIGDGVAGGDDDGAACLRNGPVVIFLIFFDFLLLFFSFPVYHQPLFSPYPFICFFPSGHSLFLVWGGALGW
jgi:hypothetical protein